MKTFQEFIDEGLKAKLRTAYIQGRMENEPQVTSFVLPKSSNPSQPGTPERAAEIEYTQKHSGGGAVKKAIKSKEKKLKKDAKRAVKRILSLKEDIERRRRELRQRQLNQMSANQQRVADYQETQRERKKAESEREELKREITRKLKRELQTEQTPVMQPNPYNVMIARRQASQKSAQIRHVHQEIGAEARAQQSAKQRRLQQLTKR